MSDPLVLDPLLTDRYSTNQLPAPPSSPDPYAPQFNYVPVNHDPFSNPGVNYLGGGLAWMGGNRPAMTTQETTDRLRSYGLPGTWNELYQATGLPNIEAGTKEMSEGNFLPGFGQAGWGAITALTLGAAPYAKIIKEAGPLVSQPIRNILKDEAGTFLGRQARYANLGDAARAETMVSRGMDPEGVRKATGWFKGPGDVWQYELSDAASRINPTAMRQVQREGDQAQVPITNLLQHPEFYRNYPGHFDKMTVRTEPNYRGTTFLAAYDNKLNQVLLNPEISPSEARSVLLHEIQHPTQEIERMPGGGNTLEFLPPDFRTKVLDTINTYDDFIKGSESLNLSRDSMNQIARVIRGNVDVPLKDLERVLGKDLAEKAVSLRNKFGEINRDKEAANLTYHNLAGESQARLVQQRRDLGPYAINRFSPITPSPYSDMFSYDVPIKDQIIRFGSGPIQRPYIPK